MLILKTSSLSISFAADILVSKLMFYFQIWDHKDLLHVFLKFISFKLEANCFTILWWFLPYIHMNQPWVYMCSPSWTPLPPPSPSHPSGSSKCTGPQRPVSCIKPGLVIHFTYDNIHVSTLFSQIIPPSPSPTDCSIHLCLFCCLAYRVIVTIFLNSIYMHCCCCC